MSKISQYLNEHIIGEITSNKAVRQEFSRDGSVLSITPELVMFPRVTNDIRKAARFSWQLAEKGHILPLTVRGGGSDQTGAAIGKGIVINTTAHLDHIIHLALKDKDRVVHVQPGVNFNTLNETLSWHGLIVPTFPESFRYSTVGGAVANNSGGQLSGRYGLTGDYVTRLEVVLANGDLIETTRINKHELNKKKGLQTFEGELYRKLEGLIEDNQDLIKEKIGDKRNDNLGYGGLGQVRRHDGSFDLTPLLIGSQGTLGIISEIVLKTEFMNKDQAVVVAVLPSIEAARDVAHVLKSLQPAVLETYDGALFETAAESGKRYTIFQDTEDLATIGSVLYVSFNDFSERAQAHKVKKTLKELSKFQAALTATSEDFSFGDLEAVREVYGALLTPETAGESLPPLVDGASIPLERHEEFSVALAELADKHHVELPLKTNWLNGVATTRTMLHLEHISDKQKMFKLIADYADLVLKTGGEFVAQSGEGRIKANAAYATLDAAVAELYQQIRDVFDPFGTLNGDVKKVSDISTLVSHLRGSYDLSDFADFSPHI
jgi:FAD/FMN-containing dehydrogenase